MTTLKDIQNELNSKKGEFVKTIVSDPVTIVTKIAEKTKSEKHSAQMIKAAQDLAKENQKYEDIIITSKTETTDAEPVVKIKHPSEINNKFEYGKSISLILETKNITEPHSCLIVAIDKLGTKTSLCVDRGITSNKPRQIDNILRHKLLNPGVYTIAVALYYDKTSKEIKNSADKQVIDTIIIEILPPRTSTSGAKTSESRESTDAHVDDAKVISETKKASVSEEIKKKDDIKSEDKKKDTTSKKEPYIVIRYPTITQKKDYFEGDAIQLVFDAYNVPHPYRCVVYAKTAGGQPIYIAEKPNYRFDHVDFSDIQETQKLPAGKYDVVVELFENTTTNRIKNSKGEPLIAKVFGDWGVIINPKKLTNDSSKDKKSIDSKEKTKSKKPSVFKRMFHSFSSKKDTDSLNKIKHMKTSWRSLVAATLIPITLYYSVSAKHISYGGPRHEIDKTIVVGTNDEIENQATFMMLTHDAEFRSINEGVAINKQYTIINDYPATFAPVFDPTTSTLAETSQFDKVPEECEKIIKDFINSNTANTDKILANLKPILDKNNISISDVNKNKIIESIIQTQKFVIDSVEVVGLSCIKGTSLVPYKNFKSKQEANLSLGFGRGQLLGGRFILPQTQKEFKIRGLDTINTSKVNYSGAIVYNSRGVDLTVLEVNRWLETNPNKVDFEGEFISNINLELIHSSRLDESSKLDEVINYFKIHEPNLYKKIVGDPAKNHTGGYLSDDRGVQICIKGHITADVKAVLVIEKFVDPAIPSSYPQDKIIEGRDPQYDERKKYWNNPEALNPQRYDPRRSKTGREPNWSGQNYNTTQRSSAGRKNMQYSGRGNRGK